LWKFRRAAIKTPPQQKMHQLLSNYIGHAEGGSMRDEIYPRPILVRTLVLLLLWVSADVGVSAHRTPGGDSSSSGGDSSIVGPVDSREAALHVKVSADLVQIPVTVMDKKDQVVEMLSQDSFSVYENGVEQTIAHFGLEETPISVCVVMDASSSMMNKLRKSVEAVYELLKSATTDDEYCLVRFSDWPETMVTMRVGPTEVAAAMHEIRAGGLTALLDAIYVGVDEVKRGQNRRKAVVLISDGGDNRSQHTQHQVRRLVREADVQIYSIGILSPENQLLSKEELNGPSLMKDISQQSGGRLFPIHKNEELRSATAKITKALRHQYVLGYYPKDTQNDGKYRHVTIKLNAPKGTPTLRAYWRTGYYAPKL
jgi:Ca-activated chloride channel family protein